MSLSEVCAAEFLAKVAAFQRDDPAHFMKPRTHPLADTIPQRFSPARGPCGRDGTGSARRRLIVKVRGDNGGAIVVVPCVENEAYRVPHPLRRFHRSQFV